MVMSDWLVGWITDGGTSGGYPGPLVLVGAAATEQCT